jgi:EAL domain-containing protein (putative c-di-GMP-specific phosphodiesterase class I)/GGDEF domain-containing protein
LLLVECASALVIAPTLLIWLPRRRAPGARGTGLPEHGLDGLACGWIIAIGATCLALHATQHDAAAGWLIAAAFFGPMFSALRGRAAAAAAALVLAAVVILGVRGRLHPEIDGWALEQGLLPAWLMLSIGAVYVHLLCAMAAERQRQTRALQDAAHRSEIAGLPNVRGLQRMLAKLAGGRVARPFRALELALPDVARFGELAGRAAMLELETSAAIRLQQAFAGRAPVIAHLATGRFAVLVPASVEHDDLRERIRAAIDARPFRLAGRALGLRAAVGVIDVPAGVRADPEAILPALSLAQQRAAASPSRFHACPLDAEELRQVWLDLDEELVVRRAIDAGRIRLLAQAIEAVQPDPAMPGLRYEVFARLLDEAGTEMAPARFLPVVERAGLAREFDTLVIRTVLAALAADRDLQFDTRTCAINITGPTLADPGFARTLQQMLVAQSIAPCLIALEISDTEALAGSTVAQASLQRLAALGIGIAFDDFGAGLASFEHLKRFRPQALKIDGPFVQGLGDEALDRELVQAIVRVARAIGARTVAEWVETDALRERLAALGVDDLQGFAIGRPKPLAELGAEYRARMGVTATTPTLATTVALTTRTRVAAPHPGLASPHNAPTMAADFGVPSLSDQAVSAAMSQQASPFDAPPMPPAPRHETDAGMMLPV